MRVEFLNVMVGDAQSVVGGYLQDNPWLDIRHVAICSVAGSTPPAVLISIWYDERVIEPRAVTILKKKLKWGVEEMELSSQVCNFFSELNIQTVQQVHEWFLLGNFPKGFGKKSQEQVREKLHALGLTTRPE